jgi:hypothetical protein
VTVVAGHAWAAEVLAKAVLLRGTPHHFDLLAPMGAEAIAIDDRGNVDATPGMYAYLAEPDLPGTIEINEFRAREQAAS